MPKEKTKMLALSALVMMVASASFFFALFFFMKNKISETVVKTAEIKTQIKKEESFSFMQKSIEENQANENSITNFIIPANSIADFIKTLDSMVASSSLKSQVGSISYESESDLSAANAELLDVQISVEGPWSNIYFFLQLLETYPLKIDIKSVSLKQFTDYTVAGKQVPEWSGDIEFTVVKFKDN